MPKGIPVFKKKWLILGLTCLLFPLYQNMSPFEAGQEVDIRDYAPQRPEGYFNNPLAAYVPSDFSGDSLNDVSQGILDHNFTDMMKRTERIGEAALDSSHSSFSEDSSATEASANVSGMKNDSSKLRFDVMNPSTVRLSYHLANESGNGWTVACQNKGQGVNLQMNHPLSSDIEVGLSHETEARTSQVRMGISW